MTRPAVLPAMTIVLALLAIGGPVAIAQAEIAPEDPAEPATAALVEGNRLFQEGDLEAAAAAYRRGWDAAAPHPTLAYNLGTTLHHLGQLPEAILWYRRAGDADDSWASENLWLARRSLGSQRLPPGGFPGLLVRGEETLRWAGVAVAWIALALLVLLPRRRAIAAGAGGLALALYLVAWGAHRWGPHPVVVLADCATAAGELPAGTEAWGRRTPGGDWHIAAASEAVCPGSTVEPVATVH